MNSNTACAAAILALSAALAPVLAGCGKRACFEWTELEGACPSQEEAMDFFEAPSCSFSAIASIDSDGDFDGELCCYDVTMRDEDYGGMCDIPQPGGGPVPPGSGSVGAGGASPLPGCFNCARVVGEGQLPECPGSVPLIEELLNCACSGKCSAACASESCGLPLFINSPECGACIQDPEAGCGLELQACMEDMSF